MLLGVVPETLEVHRHNRLVAYDPGSCPAVSSETSPALHSVLGAIIHPHFQGSQQMVLATARARGCRLSSPGDYLMISMPSMVALSVTVVNLMTICPDELAVAVNSRSTAL